MSSENVGRRAVRNDLERFLEALGQRVSGPGTLYFVGDTSQVHAGWFPWTPVVTLAAEDTAARAVGLQAAEDVWPEPAFDIVWESPGDVVPLPPDVRERHRTTGHVWNVDGGEFIVLDYDPYSVAIRAIARGDEPDYHTVLRYLRHDWITTEALSTMVEGLLPSFTSDTIAQDPAEFRRKLKGLLQMWRAESGATARA